MKITLDLTESQAHHFALWLKRIGWQEIRGNAQNEDEAYTIKDAVLTVERQINEAGFRPR